MHKDVFDLCIVGGGINGAGIARDAAGRGYKVLLLEKGDLASATSSASTKLIHGGLRYLEHYEFRLVQKSLKERDVLMNIAPHIIWPMRFILPHAPTLRPFWMIRAGVYLYDFLAGKTKLKNSIKTDIKNKFLKKQFNIGIEYSDCWVEDSRLVVLNAMDAMARGAVIKTRCGAKQIDAAGDEWLITGEDDHVYKAQMVINAAGPWVSKVAGFVADHEVKPVRLVKGSHIVIPKLYEEDKSYILQNDDGRIVFTIPYEGDYTLVGTTDIDIGHDPDQSVTIDTKEKNYLKDLVHKYFQKKLKDVDIVHHYSGVRPLIDNDGDASSASRDYEFDLFKKDDGLPFLSILGGKITTYRVLAQEVMDKVDKLFHKKSNHWTGGKKLPGGDIEDNDIDRYILEQSAVYPFLSTSLIRRYAKAYGTCMEIILDGVTSLDDMGADIGGGVYGRELDYLISYEFAKTGDDVLWRRSKLGLHLDSESIAEVHQYMEEKI